MVDLRAQSRSSTLRPETALSDGQVTPSAQESGEDSPTYRSRYQRGVSKSRLRHETPVNTSPAPSDFDMGLFIKSYPASERGGSVPPPEHSGAVPQDAGFYVDARSLLPAADELATALGLGDGISGGLSWDRQTTPMGEPTVQPAEATINPSELLATSSATVQAEQDDNMGDNEPNDADQSQSDMDAEHDIDHGEDPMDISDEDSPSTQQKGVEHATIISPSARSVLPVGGEPVSLPDGPSRRSPAASVPSEVSEQETDADADIQKSKKRKGKAMSLSIYIRAAGLMHIKSQERNLDAESEKKLRRQDMELSRLRISLRRDAPSLQALPPRRRTQPRQIGARGKLRRKTSSRTRANPTLLSPRTQTTCFNQKICETMG